MSKVGLISFESIKINENSYQRLIKLLHQETGLNFIYYRKSFIERRIKARMIRVNCQTLEEYIRYLLSNRNEFEIFLNNFNINYSYFFRNHEIFEYFQDLILRSLNYNGLKLQCDFSPDSNKEIITKITQKKKKSRINRKTFEVPILKDQNNLFNVRLNKMQNITQKSNNEDEINPFLKQTSLYQKLKDSNHFKNPFYIWSCACASGEEPYSIAMILNNLKDQIKNFSYYKIVGSDIDSLAINKARIGMYDDNAIKEMSNYFEKKYFNKFTNFFGNKYNINEDIKKNVEFIKEDVTKGHNRSWKYDIIFCRYFLIYISRENRDYFLKILESRLNNGGLLILGKTETLFKSFLHFKLVDSKNHIYMKTI